VTATATDQCGQTGIAEGEITVVLNPEARRLDDLVFPSGSARINNCAKRVLLEVLTPLLRESPASRVYLIGHRDARETGRDASTLDQRRVLNAAAVLSGSSGICAQVDVGRIHGINAGTDQTSAPRPAFCGASVQELAGQAVRSNDPNAMFRRVEVWFVPDGADIPENLRSATPLPANAVAALGCPR
jgi:hypothetical protein